jgi:hypothetical protein
VAGICITKFHGDMPGYFGFRVSDDYGRAVNRKDTTVEEVQQVSITILVDSPDYIAK